MGYIVQIASLLAMYGQAKNAALDREDEAKQAKDDAAQHAELIRKYAKAQRASAQAAFVAGGVDTSVGTPLVIDSSINRDSEFDVYNTLLSGKRTSRSLRQQASSTRAAANIELASSVLSMGASYAQGGWKRSPGNYGGYGGTGYGSGILISGESMNA
jgi:hypothetical protein